MNNFKFKFTILTPCYNSEKFIHRVFKSLNNQTFKNFEWYVVNDASIDNTHSLIEEYIKSVEFSVIYHNLKVNQGIHVNINQAIRDANGEYLIIYGHDDEIMPYALETFNSLLDKYNHPEIASVYALAKDQNGNLIGKKYPNNEFISDYWTQFFALDNEAEKFQCWKTEYLKEFYPINPDPIYGYPGAWLWGKVGARYKSIFVNKILRVYYTDVSTSITSVMKREQSPNKMFNYYRCWVNEFQYNIKNNYKRRLRGIGGFVSYGLLSGMNIWDMIRLVNGFSNKILTILFYPIAKIYNLIK